MAKKTRGIAKGRSVGVSASDLSYAVQLALFFFPAFFLISLGVATVYVPKAVVYLVALLLCSAGILFAFLAWKLVLLRQKLERFVRSFEARIVLQNVNVKDYSNSEDPADAKKLIMH
jgi:membrane protein implicated in regulation of membrane protease activity